MHVTRLSEARSYEAPEHDGMSCLRLQGKDASPARSMWMAMLHLLPGGGTSLKASPQEKLYLVVDGEVTLSSDSEEHTLKTGDSCFIQKNEPRRLENRTNLPATLALVMSEVVV